jgi:glycosyltransferase A (GT-A) superfamily protein (DUF2064 family)
MGFGTVCLVNSDSPTLPTALLIRAAHALMAPGERIVLGAAEDGGYYLLGMQRPDAHLFAGIAWSTSGVAAATRARAAALGLDVVTLPTWYDVDDAASLDRLLADADDGYVAPATRGWLERAGLRGRLNIAAQ